MIEDFRFLNDLLSASGVSGCEDAAMDVWTDRASKFARTFDRGNNSLAYKSANFPIRSTLFMAHIDEIGVIITHIDEHGFVFFKEVGGWDPAVLVGQRVIFENRVGQDTFGVITRKSTHLFGVITRKATHLMEKEEQEKIKTTDLWIDIGAYSDKEALEYVHIGDVGVISAAPRLLINDILVSKSLDNRLGAYVVLKALEKIKNPSVVSAVNSNEEIGGFGALNVVNSVNYINQIIIVDVTHAMDYPGADEDIKENGYRKIESGPCIGIGGILDRKISDKLISTAEMNSIPFTTEAVSGQSGTDADLTAMSKNGIPVGLVSIPIRYMHTPNELVHTGDVEETIRLLTAYGETV